MTPSQLMCHLKNGQMLSSLGFFHPPPFTSLPQFFEVTVVQKVFNAIYWTNLYPVDNAIDFLDTYLLNSNFSDR